MVDTRANKMKSWDLQEAWEVHQFSLSTWQLKKVFVPLLAYRRSWTLVDPTVHYFTVGLQSTPHHCRLISLSRRGIYKKPERSVTRKLQLETDLNVPRKHSTIYNCKGLSILVSLSLYKLWRGDKTGKVNSCGQRKHNWSTFSSLLHIWSGMRRFQSRCKVYSIYAIHRFQSRHEYNTSIYG